VSALGGVAKLFLDEGMHIADGSAVPHACYSQETWETEEMGETELGMTRGKPTRRRANRGETRRYDEGNMRRGEILRELPSFASSSSLASDFQ